MTAPHPEAVIPARAGHRHPSHDQIVYSSRIRLASAKISVNTSRCISLIQHQLGRMMMKRKLNWKTPLFFCLLPIFLIMIFLGFPLPMAPPPKNKPVPEVSVQEEKRKRKRLDRIDL